MIFLKRNCNINNRKTASCYYFIISLFDYFIVFDKNKNDADLVIV